MPDLPIAPDESSGVPVCLATCPSASTSVTCDCCVDCDVDREQTEVGLPCLPRVRELVALIRRRCDGCPRYEPSPTRPDGTCPIRVGAVPADGCCEEWEAKP